MYDAWVSRLLLQALHVLLNLQTILQTRKKRWSYNASKSGIFELSWQQSGLANRIAMALENRSVVIADVTRIYQL